MSWTFARIREVSGPITATGDLARFKAGDATLFVREAFVSGIAKGSSHHDDARLAVQAFEARWSDLQIDVPAKAALNHAVSAGLAVGLIIQQGELGLAGLVFGVTPKTQSDDRIA